MSHELSQGRKVRSITLPSGRVETAGAPYEMSIQLQPGDMSMVPWVLVEWQEERKLYNCAQLLAVTLEPEERS